MILLNPTCHRLNCKRFWLFYFIEFSKYMYAVGFLRDFFFYKFLNYFISFFRKKSFSVRLLYFFFQKYNLFFFNRINYLLKLVTQKKFKFKFFLKEFSKSFRLKIFSFFLNLLSFFELRKKRLGILSIFCINIKNLSESSCNIIRSNVKFPFYFFFLRFFIISRISFVSLIDQFFLILKLKGKNLRYFFFSKFFNIKRKFLLLDFLNFLKLKKRKERKLNLKKRFIQMLHKGIV